MWSDVGPHFRCYRFVWYWLIYVPGKYRCHASFNMFAEHHGKGIVDGHFGTLSLWTSLAAVRVVIKTADQLADEWRKACSMARESDPELPACEFVVFDPPAAVGRLSFVLDSEHHKLRVTKTYALSSQIRDTTKPVCAGVDKACVANLRVCNHILSGEPAREAFVPRVLRDKEAVSEWRRGYRDLHPESEPPNYLKLRRRYESQSHVFVQASQRHCSFAGRCRARLSTQIARKASAKRWWARQRARRSKAQVRGDPSDSESSSSSSCNSSSSSSSRCSAPPAKKLCVEQ